MHAEMIRVSHQQPLDCPGPECETARTTHSPTCSDWKGSTSSSESFKTVAGISSMQPWCVGSWKPTLLRTKAGMPCHMIMLCWFPVATILFTDQSFEKEHSVSIHCDAGLLHGHLHPHCRLLRRRLCQNNPNSLRVETYGLKDRLQDFATYTSSPATATPQDNLSLSAASPWPTMAFKEEGPDADPDGYKELSGSRPLSFEALVIALAKQIRRRWTLPRSFEDRDG